MPTCTITSCERKASYQVRGDFTTGKWQAVRATEDGRYCKTCADIRVQGYNSAAIQREFKRKGHVTRR